MFKVNKSTTPRCDICSMLTIRYCYRSGVYMYIYTYFMCIYVHMYIYRERTPQTSKMKNFATIVKDFWPLTAVANLSTLHVCGVLYTPLKWDITPLFFSIYIYTYLMLWHCNLWRVGNFFFQYNG